MRSVEADRAAGVSDHDDRHVEGVGVVDLHDHVAGATGGGRGGEVVVVARATRAHRRVDPCPLPIAEARREVRPCSSPDGEDANGGQSGDQTSVLAKDPAGTSWRHHRAVGDGVVVVGRRRSRGS